MRRYYVIFSHPSFFHHGEITFERLNSLPSRNLLDVSSLSPQHEGTLIGLLKYGSIVLVASHVTDPASVSHLGASMVDS